MLLARILLLQAIQLSVMIISSWDLLFDTPLPYLTLGQCQLGPAQIGKMLIVESSCGISSSSSSGQHLEAAHMEYQVTKRSSEPVCGPYSGKLFYSEMVLMCILTVSMCFKAFWLQWLLDTFIRSCGLRSKPVDTIFPWRILWSLCDPLPAFHRCLNFFVLLTLLQWLESYYCMFKDVSIKALLLIYPL